MPTCGLRPLEFLVASEGFLPELSRRILRYELPGLLNRRDWGSDLEGFLPVFLVDLAVRVTLGAENHGFDGEPGELSLVHEQ